MPDTPANVSTNQTIASGESLNDTLEVAGDHDWFRIDLTAGQTVSVALEGLTLADPHLSIRNASGAIVYQNDDGGPGLDSLLAFRAAYTGAYYIDVGSAPNDQAGTYTLSVGPYSPPPTGTMDDIAHWLTHGFWDGDAHHFDVTQGGSITVNLTALTEDSKTVARTALDLWSDVIGITFTQVTSGGQIVFDDIEDGTGAFSDGVWANGITSSATVNVSAQRLGQGPGVVRIGLQTYIHEIGHALGLGHAGDYNGGTAYSRYPYEATFLNDSSAISIMSYFDNGESSYYASRGFTQNLVVTPQLADILAVGSLYGLSTTTTRTGNTTYGFNNNSGREVFDASLHPDVAYTLFDSGGIDTLDYSDFASDQLIDLNPEAFSNVGAGVGNVVIARGTVIEEAIGGSGADTIIGNGAANVLDGGSAADKLAGGAGNDMFLVDQSGDVVTEVAGEGTDTVKSSVSFRLGANIENLTLTGAAAIDATGNGLANILRGNGAANLLDGGSGPDRMFGGAGNDTYIVASSGDVVGEGDNAGTDLVKASVTFALGSNVENLTLVGTAVGGIGNPLDNIIRGNDADNKLNGGVGADKLIGGLGDDSYTIDNASDAIVENAGEGSDTVRSSISYALGNPLENLTLIGTGGVNGSGNAFDNIISGNNGANVLTGRAGTDHLSGGGGADIFRYDDGDFGGMTAATAEEIVDFRHGQNDRIDLHAVDARTAQTGDQAFAFIGTAAFSHIAGELRYEIVGGDTLVTGDTNGDGAADFMLKLEGSRALTGADFIF